RLALAVAPHDTHDARALHDERVGADTLFDPRADPPSRGRPCLDRGDGRRLDQLHRDAVGALLADRGAGLGPAGLVEGDSQTAAATIAGRRFELAVEIGPATETLERHRPFGRVAAHHANTRRARARRRVAEP